MYLRIRDKETVVIETWKGNKNLIILCTGKHISVQERPRHEDLYQDTLRKIAINDTLTALRMHNYDINYTSDEIEKILEKNKNGRR